MQFFSYCPHIGGICISNTARCFSAKNVVEKWKNLSPNIVENQGYPPSYSGLGKLIPKYCGKRIGSRYFSG
jgi:hypothetical protein